MADSPHPLTTPAAARDDPLVTDVMTRRLVGITPESPISTALRVMADTGVRHLPVMDGQQCIGLVVEADLVRCLAQGGPLTSGMWHPVREITRSVEHLPIAAQRSDVARRMQANGADAVLVSDRGQVLGIVTATDLIRSLADSAQAAAPAAATTAS